MTTKWYSYTSEDAVTRELIYVTISEDAAIKNSLVEHPGVSKFAAIEIFLSTHHAREVATPGYLAVPNTGERLRAYMEALGVNGAAILSAKTGITAKNLLKMTTDKKALIPDHVLKYVGLRREIVTCPRDAK